MTTTTIPAAHMQRLLEDITKRKGFRKPRYAVSEGSQKGDNYLGVLYRVEVAEEGAAEAGLRLILKGMPASARRREEMRVVNFFDNEFTMYRTVLPALAGFLAEKNVDESRKYSSFPYTARCHEAVSGGKEGEDVLVLEDMRPLGFTMHDRKVGLDEQHVGAVFRSLALLHATSMALEVQRPDEFAKLRGAIKETLFDLDNPMAAHLAETVKRTYDYIKERYPEGSEGCTKLKGVLDDYATRTKALVMPSKTTPNAICHGDSWTNNLLFKYKKSGDVDEVCLVDFQLSRYAPPVLDIVYLVYSCTVREWRQKHLDRLLKEYHAALSSTLKRLGCDPDQVYSWETMQAQLRERARFGLAMAVLTIPLFLADAGEIPDLDASFDSGVEMESLFTLESKSAPERNKRLADVLEELMERGWL